MLETTRMEAESVAYSRVFHFALHAQPCVIYCVSDLENANLRCFL